MASRYRFRLTSARMCLQLRSQLLTNRPDRKDTRVFAHAAAETQTVIKDTYKPDSRSGPEQEPGFLEVN